MVMTVPVRPFMIMPWKLSLPLVIAAAGAGVAQTAAAVPVASSATVSCRFMLSPHSSLTPPVYPFVAASPDPHGVTYAAR